VTVFRG